MDISIIVVNWNTKEYLEQCLTSVYTHLPDIDCDVWVVDNASTDGSVQMVRDCFPQVNLIENEQNFGFARANNQAIHNSTGHFIWLLNSDTEIKARALDHLYDFMQTNPEAGAAGSLFLNPDGTLQTSCYPLPTLSRECWRLFHLDKFRPYGVYNMNTWNLRDSRKVEVLQGASLILRREALDQVGVLDEDYFMYTEEVDLCYRLNKGGWHLYWVPQSQVIHYGGQSTCQVAKEMFLYLYQTKSHYFRKNHGRFSVFIYKMILLIISLARLIISPVTLLMNPPKRDEYQRLAGYYLDLVKMLPRM